MNKKHLRLISLVLSLVLVISSCFIIPIVTASALNAEDYTYDSNSEPVVNLDFTGDSPTGNFGGNKAGLFDRKANDGITMYFNNGQVYRWALIKKASETSSASWNIPAGNYVVEYETKITSKGSLADDAAVNDAVEVRLAYNEDLDTDGYAKDKTDTEHFLGEKLKFQTDRQKHTMLVTLTETATRLNICLFNGAADPQLAIQSIKFYPAVSAVITVDFGGRQQSVNTNTTQNIVSPEAFGVTGWKLGETTYNVGENIPVSVLKSNAVDGVVTLTPVIDTNIDLTTAYKKFDFESASSFSTSGKLGTSVAGSGKFALSDKDKHSGTYSLQWTDLGWDNDGRGIRFNDGTNMISLPVGNYAILYNWKAVKGANYRADATNFSVRFGLTDGASVSVKATGPDLLTYDDIKDLEVSTSEMTDTGWQQGLVTLSVPNDSSPKNLYLSVWDAGSTFYFDDIYIFKTDLTVDFIGSEYKPSVDLNSVSSVTAPAVSGVTGWVLGSTTYNVGDNIPVSELKSNAVDGVVTLTPVVSGNNVYKTFDFESANSFSIKGELGTSVAGSGQYSLSDEQKNGGTQSLKYKALTWKNDGRGVRFNDGTNMISLQPGRYIISYDWMADGTSTSYATESFYVRLGLSDGASVSKAPTNAVDLVTYDEIKNIEGNSTSTEWVTGIVELNVPADIGSANNLYLMVYNTASNFYFDNITIHDTVPSYSFGLEEAGITAVHAKADSNGDVTLPDLYYQINGKSVKLGNVEYIINGNRYNPGNKVKASALSETAVYKPVFTAAEYSWTDLTSKPNSNSLGSGFFINGTDGMTITSTGSEGYGRYSVLYSESGEDFVAAGYNLGETYMVSVDYKYVSGLENAETNIVFGVTGSYITQPSDNVAHKDLPVIKTTDTEWTTKTAVITAPETYTAGNGTFSPLMAFGLNKTDAKIIVKNIKITPISDSAPQIRTNKLFMNDTDASVSDDVGVRMVAKSALYTKAGTYYENGTTEASNLRAAFRIAASYTYTDSKDKITINGNDYTVKKRGLIIGSEAATKNELLEGKNVLGSSEKDANAACFSDNGSMVEYTFKVYNISAAKKDKTYTAVPYIIIDIDGTDYKIYGDMKTMSVQSVYNGVTASGSLAWFN